MSDSDYIHINLEYLYEVADGDTDFVKEIITDYLEKVPEQFVLVEKAIMSNDAEAIRFLAHKMKSSFQFMGVQRLVEIAQEMENAPLEIAVERHVQNGALMKPLIESVLVELSHKLKSL
jgi:HPt (histidine-containing phosphotransfer) domain-containing protein